MLCSSALDATMTPRHPAMSCSDLRHATNCVSSVSTLSLSLSLEPMSLSPKLSYFFSLSFLNSFSFSESKRLGQVWFPWIFFWLSRKRNMLEYCAVKQVWGVFFFFFFGMGVFFIVFFIFFFILNLFSYILNFF